jgi:Ca2+-binding RTX toxin-like protein
VHHRLTLAAAALLAVPLTALVTSPAHASVPHCNGRPATIVLRPGETTAHGTPGPDVIVGNDLADQIDGRGGQDVICGRNGDDRLAGGRGADQLLGDGGGDILVGDRGADLLVGGRISGFPPNTLAGGPGDDRLRPFNRDRLSFVAEGPAGPGAPVVVDLRSGSATGQGHDVIHLRSHGGLGVEVPAGSVVHGTPHADVLWGADSTFFGEGGDDDIVAPGSVVHGNAGNDSISSSLDSDTRPTRLASGGRGADLVHEVQVPLDAEMAVDGGRGHDSLELEADQAVGQTTPYPVLDLDLSGHLSTADHTDSVTGFEDVAMGVAAGVADQIHVEGTDGADDIRASGGQVPVTVLALGGDDRVETGAGDDHVDGGDGTDTALTGGGQDTCVSVEQPTDCETVTP